MQHCRSPGNTFPAAALLRCEKFSGLLTIHHQLRDYLALCFGSA